MCDLFKQAQQMAPCIVFIDEIDAIGKQRYHDGRETTKERTDVEPALQRWMALIPTATARFGCDKSSGSSRSGAFASGTF